MTFVLVSIYCPKIKVGKYKSFKLQYNQYNLFPFPIIVNTTDLEADTKMKLILTGIL